MAANFPNSPNTNDTFTENGLTFVWNGSAWKLNSSSGTKGEKGQKGEVGVTGSKGQKGEKGEVGAKGQKGEIGATGGTGGTGSKGQKGEVGATGSDGATAAKGQKGEAGDKGATGGTGGAGDKGQKGEVGATGSGGAGGDKGQKGEIGDKGDKGQKGEGDKGQKGEEGPQGGGAPVGQIVAWSGSAGSLPSGYFLCDGSAISRTTYAALFTIVGTTHGAGNGSSTFNIPDLRDKFILGASNSTGDTTYPGVSPGATGGAATDTVTISGSDTVNISISGTTGVDNQTTLGQNYVHAGSGTQRRHNHSFSGSDSDTVNISGSDTVNTLPPYYALAYIIQYAQGGTTAKGQKGEQGATGSGGSTGDKGQKGEVGDKGAASSVQGPTGDKGQKGEVGATGSQTFTVSNNSSSNYIIDGQNNPTLTLVRGFTYTFNVNASGHPFYIKTSASTGTGNQYTTGVTNNGVQVGTLTFVVPSNAPATLYYICQYHGGMVGTINTIENGQKGEVGTKGQKGEIGATGDKGATGAGDKGQKGEIGNTGSTGAKGQKGEVGAGGSAGSDGSDGDKGQKGDTGAQGSTGASGPATVPQVKKAENTAQHYTSSGTGWNTRVTLSLTGVDNNSHVLIMWRGEIFAGSGSNPQPSVSVQLAGGSFTGGSTSGTHTTQNWAGFGDITIDRGSGTSRTYTIQYRRNVNFAGGAYFRNGYLFAMEMKPN